MSSYEWTSPVVGTTADNVGEQRIVDAVRNIWDRAIFLKATGLDNTADALAALLDAQSDGVPLQFGPGPFTVSAPLASSQSFVQPRVRGSGERSTIIQGTHAGDVFRLVGGSGQVNGGGISDMTIWGASATAIKVLGACGIEMKRIRFGGAGSLARAILYSNNNAAGTFTEFNSAESCNFEAGCATHVEYEKGAGSNSFHHSGFNRCRFVQPTAATGPIIRVGAGCLVYNAPWDGTFFGTAAGVPLVRNYSTYPVIVDGSIRAESAAAMQFVDPASAASVYLAGELSTLGQGVLFAADKFRQIHRGSFNADSSVTIQSRPYNVKKTLAAGATTLAPTLSPGMGAHVSATIVGPNYEYNYLLWWFKHPIAAGGSVSVIATGEAFNQSGIGAPTFSVNASGDLVITNANYSSSHVAYVGVQELGTWYFHPAI